MSINNSFDYVFYDLLDLIDNTTIKYNHKVFPEIIQGYNVGVYATGKNQWGLNLVQFFNSVSVKEFNIAIDKCLNKLTSYINNHRIELSPFLESFVDKISQRIKLFTDLRDKKIGLENLVNSEEFFLKYLGYTQPQDNEIEYEMFRNLGAYKESTEPAEFNEFAYDQIQDLLKYFLQNAITKLNKLVLFIKHEINILNTQRTKFENSENNNEYIQMIADGDIKKVIKKLLKEKHKSSIYIIQLSCRYNSLEKDKIQNIISTQDYVIQRNKISTDLITLLFN